MAMPLDLGEARIFVDSDLLDTHHYILSHLFYALNFVVHFADLQEDDQICYTGASNYFTPYRDDDCLPVYTVNFDDYKPHGIWHIKLLPADEGQVQIHIPVSGIKVQND